MLTDTQIRNTKPGAKPIKLTDGGGLYMEITPAGGKHWRFRFRLDGKESVYAIGKYPRIGLAEARRLRDDAKALVKEGNNPTLVRKQKKLIKQHENATTFKAIADEWFDEVSVKKSWSDGYTKSVQAVLNNDVYPHIGAFGLLITMPNICQSVSR